MIDWGIVARAVHVVAVVVWIGGVWLVTFVLLPAMKERRSETWVEEFARIERRFGPQARASVLLVGLSGLYMLYGYHLWSRFEYARYWWMHLMVGVWLLFALLLFLIEPLASRLSIRARAEADPHITLERALRLHRALATLSLIAVFAAVCGAHGLL